MSITYHGVPSEDNDNRGGCCGCIILILALVGLITVLQHLTWK